MSIYDILGRPIRDFGTVQSGCTMWDGKDDSGASVGRGVYIVRADVRDTQTGIRSRATAKLAMID
jgi:flagellar hook assembly protein FlgD